MTAELDPIGNDAAAPQAARRSYAVPAAEKALDILEFMAGQADGMTVTELAAGLGRTVHEIYRVMLVLEARGYLYRRANSDRYRLSLKLFELAHQMPAVGQLTDAALPIMSGLAPACMQSCHLAVLNGHEVLIVLQVDSPLPMHYSVTLGARFSFEETSSGLVIYTYSAERIRARLDEQLGLGQPTDEIASVAARAAAIRTAGREVKTSLAVGGVTNISVPIFDYLGHVVAALTVPYMPQRAAVVPLERVVELTVEAGRAISRDLGGGNRLVPEGV